jgi:hypothetical protein
MALIQSLVITRKKTLNKGYSVVLCVFEVSRCIFEGLFLKMIPKPLAKRLSTISKRKRNWTLYNSILMGLLCAVVSSLEANLIYNLIKFLNITFGPDKSGSSPIIGTYFGLFIFALCFQFIGSIDAAKHKNTNQVVAICLFHFLGFFYSLVQIHQSWTLKKCAIEFRNIVQLYEFPYEFLEPLNKRCFFDPFSRTENGWVVHGEKTLEQVVIDINDNLFRFDIVQSVQMVIALIMFLGGLAAIVISFNAYVQLGWKVYLTQGADIQKKSIFD